MPLCPFLWHVVPLPARYNVGCVNATSLPDLALHTTSWLERIVHAKIEAEPLYTRQFTRLLAAIRRGGGDRELRRRLRDSYWALQWDGEPFATRLATERCDALCRVGAHLVEKISKSCKTAS